MAEREPPWAETEPPVWDLAPAAELRRRGDVRRRRRRGARVVAGVAAVLAALVPAIALNGPGGPVLASDPTAPMTSVPDGFPIADGLGDDPTPEVARGPRAADHVTLCGDRLWASVSERATDLLLATDGASADPDQRLLLLYPDEDKAAAALSEIRSKISRCADDPDAATVLTERVGNALLFTRAPAGTEESRLAEQSDPLLRRMCVFTEEPCEWR